MDAPTPHPAAPPPWAPERVVDAGLARRLVRAAWPHRADDALEPLGSGFDNTAYLLGGTHVVRFPRREQAAGLLRTEAAVLPLAAAATATAGAAAGASAGASAGVAVPAPDLLALEHDPVDGYAWPFAGYPLLHGRTWCSAVPDDATRARAAAPLGRFLAALHGVPVVAAEAVGAPDDEIRRMDVDHRVRSTEPRIAELVARGLLDRATAASAREALEGARGLQPRRAVLAHGDLYARHLLLDEGRLSGVIDWGDAHVGEPAVDLAVVFLVLPPRARPAFLEAYGPVDAATWRLARFRAAYHAVLVLLFGVDGGEPDLARAARWALDRLGVVVDGEPA